MKTKNVKYLSYDGFCSSCQERTGPLLYEFIDNTNSDNSGAYEYFGTVVKPDFIMINNTPFQTVSGELIRAKIHEITDNNILYIKSIEVSINNEDYHWNVNNSPVSCLVIKFTFTKNESDKEIDPVKLVVANDVKLTKKPNVIYKLVDKDGIQPVSIDYVMVIPTASEDEPALLTKEMLFQLRNETKSQQIRNDRLL